MPHTWLLELYRIDMTLRSFLEICMGQWVTALCHLWECDIHAAFEPMRIKKNIFQSASPPSESLLEYSSLGFQFCSA